VGEEHGSNCRLNNVTGNGMAIVAADNTQCRFNINAYRLVFVVNKENLLYKRQALHRARQVSSMVAHFVCVCVHACVSPPLQSLVKQVGKNRLITCTWGRAVKISAGVPSLLTGFSLFSSGFLGNATML
jgi:hypothetical protein